MSFILRTIVLRGVGLLHICLLVYVKRKAYVKYKKIKHFAEKYFFFHMKQGWIKYGVYAGYVP
jgi:hypothetical protein